MELGKYMRLKDFKSVWVIEVFPVPTGGYPKLRIRRPRGAFYQVTTITAKGFLARHQKVKD